MRVVAVSDIHIDYEENAKWFASISATDYRDDLLVLAGDVADTLSQLERCLANLAARFRRVLFVPGNHDLWVMREIGRKNSLEKFEDLRRVVHASGASMQPFHGCGVSVI